MRECDSKVGYLYAVQPVGLELVKIGFTKTPSERGAALASFSPSPVTFRHLLNVGNRGRAKVWESDVLAWSLGCARHGEWRSDLDVVDQLFSEVCPAVDVREHFEIPFAPPVRRTARNKEETDFLLLYADYSEGFDGYPFEADYAAGIGSTPLQSIARSGKRRREVLSRIMSHQTESAAQ